MSDSLQIVLLQTGHAVPLVKTKCGSFPELFTAGLQKAGLPFELNVVDITQTSPEKLPYADGIIISGSASMVAENTPWMQLTKKLMAKSLDEDIPLLGVCFGHQMLGCVLGAEVGQNEKGRCMGTVEVNRLIEKEQDDLFLKNIPQSFSAQISHVDVIRNPGIHLEVVGTSPHDECHMVRAKSSRAWGVQFHPEFTQEVSRLYLQTRKASLDGEQGDGTAQRRIESLKSSEDGGQQTLAAFMRFLNTSS